MTPSRPHPFRHLLVALVAAVALVACERAPDGGGPGGGNGAPALRSTLLVTIEQVRPERLGIYGGSVPTPTLEALAGEGIVFDDASTPTPMSRPALAALHLGVAPDRSRIRDEEVDRIDPGSRTLAAIFDENGFETAAFVGSPVVSFPSGLDAGFRLFDGPEDLLVGPGRTFSPGRPAAELAANFAKWLDTVAPEKGFFAWAHFADARGLPAFLGENLDLTAYDASIASIDAAIGSMRDALARRKSGRGAVEIVVVGTQGAMLGEDGAFGDSYWLRPETLRVPLLWNGGRASESGLLASRDRRRVDLLDVSATLVPGRQEQAEGAVLFGNAAIAGDRPRRAWTWATDDRFGWPSLTAVDTGSGWKVFEWPSLREGKAKGSREAEVAAERPASPRERVMDGATRTRLSDAGLRLGPGIDLPDLVPPDANEQIREIQIIERSTSKDRRRLAWERIQQAKETRPDSLALWTQRLYVASMTANTGWISEALSGGLERFPGRPEVLHWAAHCAFALKRNAQAEALVEAAVKMGVGDADLYYDLACSRSLAGDPTAALDWLSKSIAAGYRNWDWMERDPDLAGVRSHPEYARLLQETTR